MDKFSTRHLFILLLLCSCGEVSSAQKQQPTQPNTAAAVNATALPDKQLHLNISQKTQKACSANSTMLKRDQLTQSRQTIKDLVTQAGSTASAQPWDCAVSLANDMQRLLQKQRVPRQGDWYDIVVIGAGVQASIFNAAIWQQLDQYKKSLSILLIDQNADGGAQHFQTYMYPINTGATGTSFPPTPLQISDYAVDSNPPAYSIWTQSVLSHFLSRSHFLFGQRVQKIEFTQNDANQKQYTVHIGNKLTVQTKAVVIATGLGDPKFPQESDFMWLKQQKQQAASCQNLSCVPTVLAFEDMILLERHLNQHNLSLLTALKGKQVAIIGANASGQAVKQFLEGNAPARAYTYASTQTNPSNVQLFSGSNNGRIERLGQADMGNRVALWDSNNEKHTFDVAVVAMGYNRNSPTTRVKQLIQPLQTQPQQQPMSEQLQPEPMTFVALQNSKNTPMAYQLKERCQLINDKLQCLFATDRNVDEPEPKAGPNSPFHPIFIIGPASEAIGSGKSLGDVISASATKSVQFVQWLLPQLL
ncbi:MAG: hypothetical protein AAF310_02235 [Myxococcota bacterium]